MANTQVTGNLQQPNYTPMSSCGALDYSNDPNVEERALEKLADGFAEGLCGHAACSCPPTTRKLRSTLGDDNSSEDLARWVLAIDAELDRGMRGMEFSFPDFVPQFHLPDMKAAYGRFREMYSHFGTRQRAA